jgi:hypothetical protein
MKASRLFLICCPFACAVLLLAALLARPEAAASSPLESLPGDETVSTPSPSPTAACCQSGVIGNLYTTCIQTGYYYIEWDIENSCPYTVTAYGGVTFNIAPDPNGPWRTWFVSEGRNINFPPGHSQDSMPVPPPLPEGYYFWQVDLTLIDQAGCWQIHRSSAVRPACELNGTPPPTIAPTRTPTIMPTPTTCPTGGRYSIVETTGQPLTATTDIGNHCDDCYTQMALPFPVRLYESTFTEAQVGSNGLLGFGTPPGIFPTVLCDPVPVATYSVLSYWDDLRTDTAGSGIFTSVVGVAPNRELLIEWRATTFAGSEPVRFTVRFREGSGGDFDVTYAVVPTGQQPVGVQRNASNYTWHYCGGGGPTPGTRLLFNLQACDTSTVVPTTHVPSTSTRTSTASPTATAPPVSTATGSPVSTSTSVASATGTSTGTATLTPQPTPRCDVTAWRPVPNPLGGALYDVEAIASDDVWAVGENGVMHWDGDGWTVTSVPVPVTATLQTVSAAAPDDVWAGGFMTFVHWDGSAWTQVPFPLSIEGTIKAIDARASNDVWAVGAKLDSSFPNLRTLVLHWDGNTWTHIPSPNPGTRHNEYEAVVALAPDDVWAAGQASGSVVIQNALHHWNGSSWTSYRDPPADPCMFEDIDALSPSDIWIVGYCFNYTGGQWSAVFHYNGSTWTKMQTPYIGTLYGIEMLSANEGWAVGYEGALHWDGATWTEVDTPHNELQAVAGVAPDDLWAVGEDGVMHYTPALFSDVPPNHTFYPFIQCLACRGIVSGYADGTFRPGNNVTRGQLSKIVANASGLNEPITGQTFEDVPPDSPFYIFIERLYRRGILGGYPCGSPGEPCVPPANRPYFRPQLDTTRGQVAKIVESAAGYGRPTPTEPYFQDVNPQNPFWRGIQILAQIQVMGGYPCGGPGEPCVPPNNLPYFRWANTATRGQVSKIVANTFYPGCETVR